MTYTTYLSSMGICPISLDKYSLLSGAKARTPFERQVLRLLKTLELIFTSFLGLRKTNLSKNRIKVKSCKGSPEKQTQKKIENDDQLIHTRLNKKKPTVALKSGKSALQESRTVCHSKAKKSAVYLTLFSPLFPTFSHWLHSAT